MTHDKKKKPFKLEVEDIHLVFDGLKLLISEMYENDDMKRFTRVANLLNEMKENCSWTEEDEKLSLYSGNLPPTKCIPGSNCD